MGDGVDTKLTLHRAEAEGGNYGRGTFWAIEYDDARRFRYYSDEQGDYPDRLIWRADVVARAERIHDLRDPKHMYDPDYIHGQLSEFVDQGYEWVLFNGPMYSDAFGVQVAPQALRVGSDELDLAPCDGDGSSAQPGDE